MIKRSHNIYTAFVLLLLGIMLLCAMTVTLLGAKVYSSVTGRADRVYSLRTAGAYITQKVRHADSIERTELEGRDCLVVHYTDGENKLETLIFVDDGMLREKTVFEGAKRAAVGGQPLLKLDRLEISEMNGLFEIKPVYGAYDAALLIRGGTA